jgi:LacI family transcriptional regulator, repressor for deo operon, udp, cdd, tsx, nupC, and nupG
MQVRLSEIAERAGVSISTVSRVLNDKPGVNAATRRLVLTAIDVLGYDRPARLRPRVAGLVGLIVPELENPFFPRLAQLVETNLAQHGYTPVLCSQSLGGIHEDDYVRSLLEHGVAGIIFASGMHAIADGDHGRYERLTASGLPVVLINGYLPDVGAACVSTDDAQVVDLAVAHLAHMGHTRIGLALGQERYTPVRRKAAAFPVALREHVSGDIRDIDAQELVECTTFTVAGGAQAAAALIDRGVTAIVCGSDVMALGVLRTARQRGLRVPQDLSVVGSDDSMLIEFTDPPLTTVRQPSMEMASSATRALLDLIGGGTASNAEMLLAPELVVRGSAGRVLREAPHHHLGRQGSGHQTTHATG